MLTNVRRRYGERIRAVSDHVTGTPSRLLRTRRARYGLYVAVLAVAIAYPPTLSGFWQEVLVDQIGVFVLLAVGLNVVVGYAGLLDFGYIAFYAIGAYSGAYWTGPSRSTRPSSADPLWATHPGPARAEGRRERRAGVPGGISIPVGAITGRSRPSASARTTPNAATPPEGVTLVGPKG